LCGLTYAKQTGIWTLHNAQSQEAENAVEFDVMSMPCSIPTS
jgi:hypothetical protein